MAGRGKGINNVSLLLQAPEELKYMVLVIESLGIRLRDASYNSKAGIGCIVIQDGNSAYSLGRIKKIIGKYVSDDVKLEKLENVWYLSFKDKDIDVLAEYINILKEIY